MNGVTYSRVLHALYELKLRRRSGQVRIAISNGAVSDLRFKLHRDRSSAQAQFSTNFIHTVLISVDLSTSCLVVLLLHDFLRVFYGLTQFFGPNFCHEGRDLMKDLQRLTHEPSPLSVLFTC
ncbi:hypothetical protein CY34DRAFT_787439 [Suillus luteus UH-Slu-Lm8-n1]|uniref:Uncharacterized protein n=1 Tax=Suillus luteus UH-Slu-Lm8-n1 TaxID=930992 RepID=A0A0D0BCY0_9AGAM|nr:hypothetical protein CY34DRAFT_787439 [Suillus luteus UH-Slu-Lm8-n1]